MLDIRSRSTSICRAKKQAYQFAVQDAFSKLLIVVTGTGKAYPEIDTTIDRHLEAKELFEILPVSGALFYFFPMRTLIYPHIVRCAFMCCTLACEAFMFTVAPFKTSDTAVFLMKTRVILASREFALTSIISNSTYIPRRRL